MQVHRSCLNMHKPRGVEVFVVHRGQAVNEASEPHQRSGHQHFRVESQPHKVESYFIPKVIPNSIKWLNLEPISWLRPCLEQFL
jgi:hypothetical protein